MSGESIQGTHTLDLLSASDEVLTIGSLTPISQFRIYNNNSPSSGYIVSTRNSSNLCFTKSSGNADTSVCIGTYINQAGYMLNVAGSLWLQNHINANNFRVNNTVVIDSSQNLTNIGTVGCGAITSTGNMSVTGTVSVNGRALGALAFSNVVSGSISGSVDASSISSGILAVEYGGSGTTTSTGSGSVVRSISPQLYGAVGIGTSSLSTYTLNVAGTTRINSEKNLFNKLLVLWDGDSNESLISGTRFFGFGMNNNDSNTLRYQVNDTRSSHKFFAESTLCATINSSGIECGPIVSSRSPGGNYNGLVVNNSNINYGSGAQLTLQTGPNYSVNIYEYCTANSASVPANQLKIDMTRGNTTTVDNTYTCTSLSTGNISHYFSGGNNALTNSSYDFPPSGLSASTTNITGMSYGNGTYIASSSPNSNVSTPAWKAFDSIKNTSFYQSGYSVGVGPYVNYVYANTGIYTTSTTVDSSTVRGEWLQIQLPERILLTSYTIHSKVSQTLEGPSSFVLAGSIDSITWVTVNVQNSLNLNSYPNGSNTFPVTTSSMYNYFRLIGQSILGETAGPLAIGELVLTGKYYPVDALGTIGVNNPSPVYTLDVTGDTNTTGAYRVGGVPIIGSSMNLSNIKTISCDSIASPQLTGVVRIGPNGENNKMLVLWEGNSNESLTSGTNFFGFGINTSTLRYQVDNNITSSHNFYVGSTLCATINSYGIKGQGSNITSLNAANIYGTLGVPCGGTGANNLTTYKVIVGNGTSPVLTPTNLHWDNANNRLGVSNVSPAYTLDVSGVVRIGPNGENNKMLVLWDEPNSLTESLRSGSNFYGLGMNAGALRYQAYSGTHQFYVGSALCGTIGSTAVSFSFLNSTGVSTSGASWTFTSDARLKTNVTPLESALDKVVALKPVRYQWKKGGSSNIGFIAQDVEQVIPEIVDPPTTDTDYYGIRTTDMIPFLVKAIQEQQQQINDLKQQIANITKSI